MRIRVLFFGQLRDIVGTDSEEAHFAPGVTLEGVFRSYAARFPRLEGMAGSVAMARNQRFARRTEVVKDGDELAIMPPVSGGSGWLAQSESDGVFAAITREAIDSSALVARIQGNGDGAVIVFEGVVRDNSHGRQTLLLDYQCYVPLALRQLARIGGSVLDRFDVHRIALVHRIGKLQVREASVSIVVASAHRLPAYEASLAAINEVKRAVPVWKKEHFADGEVWVEGEWDESLASYSVAGSS